MTDVHVPPDEAIETEFVCPACDESFSEDSRHYAYENLCGDCGNNTFTCEWCNHAYTYEDSYTCDYPSEVIICSSCYETGTSWCEHCGVTYDNDNYSRCPNGCDDRDSDCLLNYGYKPYPIFHDVGGTVSPARGVVYMGVELEMEAEGMASLRDGVDTVRRRLGDFAYCKDDSSLSHGMEMVTHPMTLEYAQNRDWSVLSSLRQQGFRSWDTTTAGMHIHVARTAFDGPSHLYRFTQLVLKNEPACTSFAGRTANGYCSFRDGYQPGFLAKVIKGREYGSRGAVNLQNGATVEVRMFRGSLKKKRLLANLEFVHAAVEYTRVLTVPQVATGGLSWRAFATWITDNRETYPHLFASLSLDPSNTSNAHMGA